MSLTLFIRNADRLDNGSPLSLVLDQRGAIIGRAATADWSLPDAALYISSRHCEIRFTEGRYELIDRSTNGTFMLGESARLPGPHVLAAGDVFVVGQFEIAAALDDAAAIHARAEQPAAPQWQGWGATGEAASAPAANLASWDARPPGAAISGTGPMSHEWAAPPTAAASPASGGWAAPPSSAPVIQQPASPRASSWATPVAAAPSHSPPAEGSSPWNVAPVAPGRAASEWSSAVTPPSPPTAEDIWGNYAASNVVDWARGGFGQQGKPAFPPVAPQPVAATPPAPAPTPASAAPIAARPAVAPVHAPASGLGAQAFAAALGVPPERFLAGEEQTMMLAGRLLRRLIAGMVVMLEARARAKSQLGAQSTSLQFDGNNPLKFARSPELAIEQVLNQPQHGFMDGERAVEDAFRDLQAHQVATLKAMQRALGSTLDRFSPGAIRSRSTGGGFLSRILPGARDAALWAAYEREFSGVVKGSDEAFMDIFASEFRRAYDEAVRQK